MRAWLNESQTLPKLLLWTAVAAPVMHLHYNLFATGSLHGRGAGSDSAVWSYSLQRSSLPYQCVQLYSHAFDESQPQHFAFWELPRRFLGELRNWQASFLLLAMKVVNLTMGNVWRRFCLRLNSFPFRLTALLDPQ
eukprot:6487316-Amphidinium_carterae.2